MALISDRCEFPLLRSRFWPDAARHSDQSPEGAQPDGMSGGPPALRESPSPRQTRGNGARDSLAALRNPGVRSLDLGILARGELGPADTAAAPDSRPSPDGNEGESQGGGGVRRNPALRSLDLKVLPRDDSGPPSELQARRQKFALFEKDCSEVAPGLCVAGMAVAQDREILRKAGVTHVVNCVGMLPPATPFADELKYLVLHLLDVNDQDITCVFFDVMAFIEAARSSGGCVLVHCSQGVSRSVALVVAFLMWKLNKGYYEVFEAVKAVRGVASPNIGFGCQLIQWQKRRASPPAPARLYRLAAHSPGAASYLVPKLLPEPRAAALDPRGAFVVQLPEHIHVWQGAKCPAEFVKAAQHAAEGLKTYERPAAIEGVVVEGQEPAAVREALQLPEGFAAAECRDYDADFKMYEDAATAAVGAAAETAAEVAFIADSGTEVTIVPSSSSGGAAANGTPRAKTPRAETTAVSPNQRSRKMRRSEERRRRSIEQQQAQP